MEQQVVAVGIAGRRRRCPCRLGHPVVDVTPHFGNCRLRCRITGQDEEQPADAFQGEVFQSRLTYQGPRLGGIVVVEQLANIESVGGKPAARFDRVPGGNLPLDIAEIIERAADHVVGHGVPFQTGAGESMGRMHAVVGPDFTAAPPDGEAAPVVLQSFECLQIPFHGHLNLIRSRQSFSVKCRQQIPQCGHGKDA